MWSDQGRGLQDQGIVDGVQAMEEHNIEPQNQARLLERLATLMYVTDLSDPKGMEYLARALKIYEGSGQTERERSFPFRTDQ